MCDQAINASMQKSDELQVELRGQEIQCNNPIYSLKRNNE